MNHYDFNIVHECLLEHKPDLEKLYIFEYSNSLENLPNDRNIKCYVRCLFVKFGLFEENSTVLQPVKFLEAMNEMTIDEQNRYLKMGKKCIKKNKDLCEMGFQQVLCYKKKSLEDFYLLWRNDTKPGPAVINY